MAPLVRLAVALFLLILAIGHSLFALANIGFIERLPKDLDVLVEAIGSSIAAAAFLWAAWNHFRRRAWGKIVLAGAAVFACAMTVSIFSGASSPEMIQVVIPALVVAVVRTLVERRRRERNHGGAIPDGR